MNSTRDFLVEIGTEELPSKELPALSKNFAERLCIQLNEAQLTYESRQAFATPRRLAVLIKQLAIKPNEKWIERKGPSVLDAFDATGKPTSAALGFAKSCGVLIDTLEKKEFGKTVHLIFRQKSAAHSTLDLLPEIVKSTLEKLSVSRSMRWGNYPYTFLRPIRWIVMLFGEQVIPANLFGLTAGHETYGHRFHHPGPIALKHPCEYVSLLESKGYVIPEFEHRKNLIRAQIERVSQSKGIARIEEDLLTEVTGLVEWPNALMGSFSEDFLALPDEVLMVTMKNHQRYFPITNPSGKLLPYFVLVSNLAHASEQIVSGNERVLKARLSDAKFFYEQDSKQPFLERLQKLANIVFQKELGHLLEKTERMEVLSAFIAKKLKTDAQEAMVAATLSKLDLTTEMVGEFPELQGVMGYYYAQKFGYSKSISETIRSHYQPRFSGDEVPSTQLGAIIALADKIDTLVGIFGTNQIPKGDKDPFGLRRNALGILRILIEKSLPLNLYDLLEESLRIYEDKIKPDIGFMKRIFDFIMERLRAWYIEQGIHTQTFSAVLACQPSKPLDFHLRLQALQAFQSSQYAQSLIMMNKRVDHLLKKQLLAGKGWDPALFEHKIEQVMADAIIQKQNQINLLEKDQNYKEMLSTLIDLESIMNQFFDEVLVMVDNLNVRQNRLELLYQLQKLFLHIADIRLL